MDDQQPARMIIPTEPGPPAHRHIAPYKRNTADPAVQEEHRDRTECSDRDTVPRHGECEARQPARTDGFVKKS